MGPFDFSPPFPQKISIVHDTHEMEIERGETHHGSPLGEVQKSTKNFPSNKNPRLESRVRYLLRSIMHFTWSKLFDMIAIRSTKEREQKNQGRLHHRRVMQPVQQMMHKHGHDAIRGATSASHHPALKQQRSRESMNPTFRLDGRRFRNESDDERDDAMVPVAVTGGSPYVAHYEGMPVGSSSSLWNSRFARHTSTDWHPPYCMHQSRQTVWDFQRQTPAIVPTLPGRPWQWNRVPSHQTSGRVRENRHAKERTEWVRSSMVPVEEEGDRCLSSSVIGSETVSKRNETKRAADVIEPKSQVAIKKVKGLDKLDLLCQATLEIGPLQENPTGCSCPKSKCIALYCDCFKAGRRCDPQTCGCTDCKNTVEESGVNGARTKAIRSILARNPRAFLTAGMATAPPRLAPGQVACNCIRSRCLKLYCSCFQIGKACDSKACTCVGCCNTDEDSGGERKLAIQLCLEKRPDAFKMRVREPGLGCACKNNKCIRKYCECFRTKLACTSKCSCRHCENRGDSVAHGSDDSSSVDEE